MRCGNCDLEPVRQLEIPLQGLYCIDCIGYCPHCETAILPNWVLECNEGVCMSCAVEAFSEEE